MEARSMDSFCDVEGVSRWTRVGKLGTEVGLREAGCSEKSIAKTLRYLGGAEIFDSSDEELHSMLSTTEDGPAVLLATLGRGISSGLRRVKLMGYRGGFPRNEKEAIALAVNLRSNPNITELMLDANQVLGTVQGCTLLANALRTNTAIQHLAMPGCNIESEAVKCLTTGLLGNKTLITLDLSRNSLWDAGIAAVANFLSIRCSLKSLNLFRTHCYSLGASHMASALEGNNTLEVLDFGGNRIGTDGMEILLEPLSQNVTIGEAASFSNGPKNTTLKTLRMSLTDVKHFPGEAMARMIATNKNLSALHLRGTSLTPEDWEGHIFASLKENETLEELDLSRCDGLTEQVYESLMDLLQSSATGLKKIVLFDTDLDYAQGRVDEELRINLQYRGQLRGQSQVPTTAGRLVLCGFEFAGKTAIRKTMERLEQRSTPCAHQLTIGTKKVVKMTPGLQRFLFGKDAHRELGARTRGFDILVLHEQGLLASVWDFAGQIEYYALHDYIFPNTVNSCFLYVCSSRCPPETQDPNGKVKDLTTMREECEFWMRFIASNTKPRQVGEHQSQGLPQVRFVLTHKDTLDFATLSTSKQYAEDVVKELKHRFEGVVTLCQSVEVVNAHSSEDVEHLISLTSFSLEEILEHQTEYTVCKAVRTSLAKWSGENPSKPLLSLGEFRDILKTQVRHSAPGPYLEAKLYEDSGKEVVLAYLNDTGDLIFPKGLDFIVVNPRWFGIGVLGSLIETLTGLEDYYQRRVSKCTNLLSRPKFFKLHHKEGFAERQNIESLLNHSLEIMNLQHSVSVGELIQLMIHLELCFEKEPGNAASVLFIPTLLNDEMELAANGRRQLRWKLERDEPFVYLGRRLECADKSLTFLTPGFFPRLQVHLRNYFHQWDWTRNPGFDVGRNLICFAENGVEVCVEYSGSIDYFVDILVRSSKPHHFALQFVEKHVVKIIVQFCASLQGCQGVLLVEAVIRPACVQELHLCVDRKAQGVLITNLRAHLADDSVYEHTWGQKIEIEGVKDTDFARDLLEGEGSHMRFLQFSQSIPETVSLGASTSSQGKEYLSSVQQQFPKLFYPSIEDVGWLRQLDGKLSVQKLTTIKLHLMCDHKDGAHKVEGQPGRTMRLNWKDDAYDLSLVKLAITLLRAGVGVGASIAGVSSVSVPQFDTWVDNLFHVPGIPEISGETLNQLINQGKSQAPVSEEVILKALGRYLKIDPYTEGIKTILNLKDGEKFRKDFRLRKVVYTETAHLHRVGWVCAKHYESGFQRGILQSVPYTLG